MPFLEGVWAKIERAKQHRDTLEIRINEHLQVEHHCPRFRAEYDPASGYHIFRISSVPDSLRPFVLDVAVSVGDIVHNLRSALDHLAFQLAMREARRHGRRLTLETRRSIQFPIHSYRRKRRSGSPAGWLEKEDRYRRWFGQNNVATIERFQPYHGRAGRPDRFVGRYRHQLTVLRQISNRDKHTLPIIIAAVPIQMKFHFPEGVRLAPMPPQFPDGTFAGDVLFGNASKTVKMGAEVMRHPLITTCAPHDLQMGGKITPSIQLSRGGTVTFEMDRITEHVVLIVNAFQILT